VAILNDLKDKMKTDKNYKVYRKALADIVAIPHVPFLGTVMYSLFSVDRC
jgi:hypothetical protein